MKIEDFLKGSMQLEVRQVVIQNAVGVTGAKERKHTVYLRTIRNPRNPDDDFGESGGYIDINFDISSSQLADYPPETRFRVKIEKI